MMRNHCAPAFLAAALLGFITATAATAAQPGDIAIIGFSSDNPDLVAFVALNEIPAGTTIRFTDSGWQSSGSFRANEGGIQYTATSTLSPGTVISKSDPFTSSGWAVNNAGVGSSFALSSSGDQVLAFQGDASNPNFIHSVTFDSTGYSNASSSNTTALPQGLVEGVTAVNLGETDNAYYDGPTTGSPEDILNAIGNAANWTTSDSGITLPNWTFQIQSGPVTPQVTSVTTNASSYLVNEQATVTVYLSSAPVSGTPAVIQLDSGAFASEQILTIYAPSTSGAISVAMANEGVWTIDAIADDGAIGSAQSTTFSVGEQAGNPPQAYAGADRTVDLVNGTAAVSLVGATAADPDGLAGLTYAWTPASATGIASWQSRTGSVASTSSPAAATVTFNAVGAYTLTLTVTDDEGLTDADTLNIIVNDPAPADPYDPPASYYNGATGQGSTLKSQISQIITSGHVQQDYGDFKYSSIRYDADPNQPGNILLVYSRASVDGDWDSGNTWNREHVWPQSRQPGSASDGTTGNLGDPHALRPASPTTNSQRGNKPFGLYSSVGSYGSEGSYYFPGDIDKGDIARSLFYSATRYMSTLTLVSGMPDGYEMGDLDAALRWHYTDMPDTFERRRNHMIYQDQYNRNPYIDHPEFVWSVFGDGANDSTLYVSATEPADGASSQDVDFGSIIVNAPAPGTVPVTLRKSGQDPTYYAVSALGNATSTANGRYNTFDFGSQQRSFDVGLATFTSSPGYITGSVVVDNLDVCSQGQGQGSADGNDVINLSLTVLDHSEGSFASDGNFDTLLIDFGTIGAAAGIQTQTFTIYNLASPSGYTARMDMVATSATGDEDVLRTDAFSFVNLAPGAGNTYTVEFHPGGTPRSVEAVYVFSVEDEELPGAAAGQPLVLTLRGTVAGPSFPFDDDADGDIDLLDAANFLGCLAGPSEGPLTSACENHDADVDGDVDLRDAAAFQAAFTGSTP